MNPPVDGSATSTHWSSHAGRWNDLGRPLKPGPEDVGVIQQVAEEAARFASGTLTALLLGVTPEVALLPWPRSTSLIAADHAVRMVSEVWPGRRVAARSAAVVADWRKLPLASSSVGLAVGDGSYNSVESVEAQRDVSRELLRILKPGGLFALRIYARPRRAGSSGDVVEALKRGRFGSFSAFKLSLLMSMPAGEDGSVRLHDAWETWSAAGIEKSMLALETGWPLAAIETIDAYRGKDARYVFLSLDEMRQQLAPYFVETGMVAKSYELGECCPTLLMRPRT